MPWEQNSGGPWGGGGGKRGGGGGNGRGGGGPQSPWGGGGSGGGPGRQPPDVEEFVRRSQEKLKGMIPGGFGTGPVVGLIAVVVIAFWFATGFYRVEPDQQGVELVFGELHQTTAPGLNYNFPAPIGEVLTPSVTAINQVVIGFRAAGSGAAQDVRQESEMLTGDENIISIHFAVFWRIKDAGDFLFNIRNPEESVKNAAEAAMREIVGKNDFEFTRTEGRTQIAQQTHTLMQSILDSYFSGVEVTQVNLQKVDPPADVIEAFRDVQAASADKEATINKATAYFNQVTERAKGEADQITRAAEAYKQERIDRATGESERFNQIYAQYAEGKDITRRRIYLQMMEEILGDIDKVVVGDGLEGGRAGSGVVPYLPIDRMLDEQRRRADENAAKTNGSD